MKRFFIAGSIIGCVILFDLVLWFFVMSPSSQGTDMAAFSGSSGNAQMMSSPPSVISVPSADVRIMPE